MQRKPRLTRRDWTQIALQTFAFTFLGILISLAGAMALFSIFSAGLDGMGMTAAIGLPLILGGPTTFYLSFKNAQLRDAYRRLEIAAAHDSLTACLNHGAFMERAKTFLKGADGEDVRGALLVVDADYFKSVNDRFGHHIGDAALRQIASRIKNAIRKGDIVGRLGGEEFGVLLRGVGRVASEAVAERIRRAVQTVEFEAEGKPFSLSVSIGGAVFEHKVDYDELFRSADERLYKVKNSGRNSVDLMHLDAAMDEPPMLLKAG